MQQLISGGAAAGAPQARRGAALPNRRRRLARRTRSLRSGRWQTWVRWHTTASSSPPDRAYRRPVTVLRPRLAPLAPGPGLDASAAQTLHRLLSAEARAWALVNAAAVARCRSLGASEPATLGRRAGRRGPTDASRARLPRRYVEFQPCAPRRLQRCRPGGAPEVTVDQSRRLRSRTPSARAGCPPTCGHVSGTLGLRRADQRTRRQAHCRQTSGRRTRPDRAAQRRLPARRDHEARQAAQTVAARSRKRPLVSSKGGPRTVAGVRPHASKSSGRRRT